MEAITRGQSAGDNKKVVKKKKDIVPLLEFCVRARRLKDKEGGGVVE